MPTTVTIPDPVVAEVNEETTFSYTTILEDEDGNPIAASAIDSITCTIRESASGDIVNTRDAQDVKNTNNGTIHATSGLFTFAFQQGDTGIINTDVEYGQMEEHLVTFVVVYSTSRKASRNLIIRVKSLQDVT